MLPNFIHIDTERTRIRRIEKSDLTDYFALYSDAEAMQYRGQKPFKTIDDAMNGLAELENDWRNKTKYRIGIAEKISNKLIGTFLIKEIKSGSCEIGYSLHRNFWRKGIMTEVCKAMIHYLCEKENMQMISATVKTGNENSILLLYKLGFTHIGTDDKNILHFIYLKKENPHRGDSAGLFL